MLTLIALCRCGYESVTCDELTEVLARVNIAGYGQFRKNSAWLAFHLVGVEPTPSFMSVVEKALIHLIFPRQLFWQLSTVTFTDPKDRVSDVLLALKEVSEQQHQQSGLFKKPCLYDDVLVEYPDTEEAKVVAKFAKKFTVPLRQALRKSDFLSPKNSLRHKKDGEKQVLSNSLSSSKSSCLHLMLEKFESAILGVSILGVSKPLAGGVTRLKFPPKAPSRSTLKLEDAILNMLSADERKQIFYSGANAVDLGACPGGWTYQLVQRGMHVEAVDNGSIDDALMQTGLVEHYEADGFAYAPQYKHVTLVVCDMIEKPDRVTALMVKWLTKRRADHAVFNLKLPMKQRYKTVQECLQLLESELQSDERHYRIDARHLYHDRDEITVCVISNDS